MTSFDAQQDQIIYQHIPEPAAAAWGLPSCSLTSMQRVDLDPPIPQCGWNSRATHKPPKLFLITWLTWKHLKTLKHPRRKLMCFCFQIVCNDVKNKLTTANHQTTSWRKHQHHTHIKKEMKHSNKTETQKWKQQKPYWWWYNKTIKTRHFPPFGRKKRRKHPLPFGEIEPASVRPSSKETMVPAVWAERSVRATPPRSLGSLVTPVSIGEVLVEVVPCAVCFASCFVDDCLGYPPAYSQSSNMVGKLFQKKTQ